jgi:peptide/nickel transport system permease protein
MSSVSVLRRVATSAASFVVLSMLVFLGVEALPGDAVHAQLGLTATPESVAHLRHDLHLDDGLPVRYGRWLGSAAHGDLGTSVVNGEAVATVMARALEATIPLVLLAIVAIVAVSLVLGVVAGTRPTRPTDRVVSGTALVLSAVPPFVIASVLVSVVALRWHWFPAVSLIPRGSSAWAHPDVLVLPVVTLVLAGSAWATRLVRAVVADANTTPHVEAARLAGLPERRVVVWHLVPDIVGPCAQVLAWLPAFALGATVVVERAFGYPGIGSLLVDAVHARDAPMIEGIAVLFAAVMTCSFLAADLCGAAGRPRSGKTW